MPQSANARLCSDIRDCPTVFLDWLYLFISLQQCVINLTSPYPLHYVVLSPFLNFNYSDMYIVRTQCGFILCNPDG